MITTCSIGPCTGRGFSPWRARDLEALATPVADLGVVALCVAALVGVLVISLVLETPLNTFAIVLGSKAGFLIGRVLPSLNRYDLARSGSPTSGGGARPALNAFPAGPL